MKRLNDKHERKIVGIFITFALLALLTVLSGCHDLPSMLAQDESIENLQIVRREKLNLPIKAAKIDVAPNSDALTEDAPPENIIAATKKNDYSAEVTPIGSNIESGEQSVTVKNIVTHNSFGKIKAGMTVRQASQAFGIELIAPNGTGECYYVEPKKGFKGVDFMVIEGKIARIDIASKAYATDKGAKIGDTEAKIKRLYKQIKVQPQKYDEKRHDMEIYSSDKKYLLIFETDGKVVTGFRAGRAEEVSWVERCG